LIPAIVMLLMVVVGTGLQVGQFRSVLRNKAALVGGSLAQVLLLPAGALIIVYFLDPSPELAAGLILVAACPGGALSNFYCHLARLNVPLSVTLTAVSSVASFLILPLILAVAFPVVASTWGQEVPALALAQRLSLFLLLPIGAGMLLRYFFSSFVMSYANFTRAASLILVVLLLTLIIVDQWQNVIRLSLEAAVIAVLFTGFAVFSGWGSGYLLGLNQTDRFVFSVEFAVRNVGAAALVAASTLGHPEFVAFGALFVVFQFPLIVLFFFFYQNMQFKIQRESDDENCLM